MKDSEMYQTIDVDMDGIRPLLSHYFSADGTCKTFSRVNELFEKIFTKAGFNPDEFKPREA
jgi:hypothetical protein